MRDYEDKSSSSTPLAIGHMGRKVVPLLTARKSRPLLSVRLGRYLLQPTFAIQRARDLDTVRGGRPIPFSFLDTAGAEGGLRAVRTPGKIRARDYRSGRKSVRMVNRRMDVRNGGVFS